MIKVGCCGFPVGRRVYFEHFPCVEVQQTFYHPPEERTLEKWRSEAPEEFEFTLKAWQLITHEPKSPTYRRLRFQIPEEKRDRYGGFRPTDEVFKAWEVTRRAAELLRARIVIFQCPQSFRPTEEAIANMRAFFGSIDRGGLLLGWEPRGWPPREVEPLCRELELLHVVDPFQGDALWDNLIYWRLHGRGGYRYRYSDDELRELMEKLPEDRPCYVMFNNTSMFQDAKRFMALLRGDGSS